MLETLPMAGGYAQALAGGILVGLGAAVMLVALGRIAGISGIVGGLLRAETGDRSWRGLFLGGLVAGGVVLHLLAPAAVRFELERSTSTLLLAGFLVGFGTRLGNGCTSGHGVCGVSRGSLRSLVATLTFMATGMLAVLVARALGGKL